GFFVFGVDPEFSHQEKVTWKEVRDSAVLPLGLFPRLVCKWLDLCSKSNPVGEVEIGADIAYLWYGNTKFCVQARVAGHNCIRLVVTDSPERVASLLRGGGGGGGGGG